MQTAWSEACGLRNSSAVTCRARRFARRGPLLLQAWRSRAIRAAGVNAANFLFFIWRYCFVINIISGAGNGSSLHLGVGCSAYNIGPTFSRVVMALNIKISKDDEDARGKTGATPGMRRNKVAAWRRANAASRRAASTAFRGHIL